MKINDIILQEADEKVLDYFVVTSEISKSMASIEKLNEAYALDNKDVKVLGELKKETFLYQFYNVFLVKLIANIGLLYKLIKLQGTEISAEMEEKVTNIISSDPETMAVQGGKIVVVDEHLRQLLENEISVVSKDEVVNVKKAKNEKRS